MKSLETLASDLSYCEGSFKHVGFKAEGSSGTQQGLCFLLVNKYLFSPKVIPNRKGKTPDSQSCFIPT